MASSTPQMLMLDGLRIGEWILDGCETTRVLTLFFNNWCTRASLKCTTLSQLKGRRPQAHKGGHGDHRAAPSIAVRSISSDLVTGVVCRCPACWMAKIGVVSQRSGKTTTRAVAPSGHELSFPPKEAMWPTTAVQRSPDVPSCRIRCRTFEQVPRTLEGPFGRLSLTGPATRCSPPVGFSVVRLVGGGGSWRCIFLVGFLWTGALLGGVLQGAVAGKRKAHAKERPHLSVVSPDFNFVYAFAFSSR